MPPRKRAFLAFAMIAASAAVAPAHAALLADIDTTHGRVTVELQHTKAPKAVANFITLALGTRPHIDPLTGSISQTPFYTGQSFSRVKIQDNPTIHVAQTGSGAGDPNGGPGYTFRDEFSDLRHGSYGLSMANNGPNTNGSRIFFVGDIGAVNLDKFNDKHTLFGKITDTPSRAVVDAIIAAGNNGASITGVSIRRTDAGALAFDELAQSLPTVGPVSGVLSLANGAVNYTTTTALTAGQQLSIFRTPNITSWTPLDAAIVGFDNAPAATIPIDTVTSARAFYRLAKIDSPGSLTPASLANRTLFIDAPVMIGFDTFNETYTYQFDATGTGGTLIYSYESSPNPPEAIDFMDYRPTAYGAALYIRSQTTPDLLITLGFDSENVSQIAGRHQIYQLLQYSGGQQWGFYVDGTMTLSK